jgi:hypothetical protein
MPRTRRRPTPPVSVKDDRTAALRPVILAAMRALPGRTTWTKGELMDATRRPHMTTADYDTALRKLTRQGKLLKNEGLPGCPAVYRLPPAMLPQNNPNPDGSP